MKYNWLKPISFTSIFEFEVDPYMEWLLWPNYCNIINNYCNIINHNDNPEKK